MAAEPQRPKPKSNLAGERRRRPQPPTSDDYNGIAYDVVLAGWDSNTSVVQLQSELMMPPTKCDHIEIIPDDVLNGPLANGRAAHWQTVNEFVTQSGFGFMRMPLTSPNKHGVRLGSPDINRVELVSLLLHEEPCVYVLHQMPTPPRARLARRRPLDEFEQRSLDAVREGADLAWTPEAPTRMFGAIRAKATCLECHPGTQEYDLLGAFSYYFDAPVYELKSPWRDR